MPEIVRRVPDALLLVTCTREYPRALGRYRQLLETAGISASVRFLGTVPYERLPRLNRAARLYVEPGWDRAMSLSVKEAMACGTPVVRGDAGWEEVSDDVEGYLVRPDDPPAYVDRVVRLLSDNALRARMSRAAASRIVEQSTWDAVADRIARHAGSVPAALKEAV